MPGSKVDIDSLSSEIMKAMEEYAATTADDMKKAVKDTGKLVQKEIANTAPQRTGDYAKSWKVKTVSETSESLELVVYSKNRYQIAHLLEHGHAKRNGGRVSARPHIAKAESKGEEYLDKALRGALEG